jgi:hypothetical protein
MFLTSSLYLDDDDDVLLHFSFFFKKKMKIQFVIHIDLARYIVTKKGGVIFIFK